MSTQFDYLTWTAEKLEAEARRCLDSREESWNRSDTDGFLSQWADGLYASLYRRQAEVVRNGGMAEFPGLYSRTDPSYRIPAKLISTNPPWAPWTTSWCWAILDPTTGKFVGEFIPAYASDKVQAKHNVVEKPELAPAEAVIEGKGKGLSGTAWVAVRRKK